MLKIDEGRTDLKHLRWSLINIRQISPEEADKHIKEIIELEKNTKTFREKFKNLKEVGKEYG